MEDATIDCGMIVSCSENEGDWCCVDLRVNFPPLHIAFEMILFFFLFNFYMSWWWWGVNNRWVNESFCLNLNHTKRMEHFLCWTLELEMQASTPEVAVQFAGKSKQLLILRKLYLTENCDGEFECRRLKTDTWLFSHFYIVSYWLF